MRAVRWLAVLAAVTPLGCGGGAQPPGEGRADTARPPRDACSLVSRDRAEAILTGPMAVAPARESARGSATCRYRARVDDGLAFLVVSVRRTRMPAAEFTRLAGAVPPGAHTRPATGVGDLAYFETDPRQPGAGILSVLAGDVPVVVQVLVPGRAEEWLLARARTVGRSVVARLGPVES